MLCARPPPARCFFGRLRVLWPFLLSGHVWTKPIGKPSNPLMFCWCFLKLRRKSSPIKNCGKIIRAARAPLPKAGKRRRRRICTFMAPLGAQVRAGPHHPVNAGVLMCRIRNTEVAPIHGQKAHFWDPPEMSAYDWHGQKGLRPRCKGPFRLGFCFVGRTRDDGPVPDGQRTAFHVQNHHFKGLKKCPNVISRRSARSTLYAGIAIRLCFA